MLDSLANEYGWTESVIRRLPLARVFVLYAAICARYGHDGGGPNFVERAWLRAFRKARAGVK